MSAQGGSFAAPRLQEFAAHAVRSTGTDTASTRIKAGSKLEVTLTLH